MRGSRRLPAGAVSVNAVYRGQLLPVAFRVAGDPTRSGCLGVRHVFAGIGVADYSALREWYERFMGRPADLVPNDIEVCWQLTDSAWIYVKEDAERAGNAFITILVDDLDARLAELERNGIASGPVDTNADGVRTAVVTDPEGNTIQLGETPG